MQYQLGYCKRTPLRSQYSSYTIPVSANGKLINIRHRIVSSDPKAPRYLPHVAGLGTQLFNSDMINKPSVKTQGICICEGEKKSIILSQEGFPNVGIMGKRSFKQQWLKHIKESAAVVYICLDPDAKESALHLAKHFAGKARGADFPVKPDEFFFRYNGTPDDFRHFLAISRPVT